MQITRGFFQEKYSFCYFCVCFQLVLTNDLQFMYLGYMTSSDLQ